MNSIPVKALFFSLCCVNLSYGAVFLESEALFIRTTGQPQEETVTFPVYNPTIPYIIKVQNGPDGYDRISSASVSFLLNDQEIFTSSDFNQQVEWLETPITVTTENTLRVLLTSKPGGALKIWIFGSDDYSPSISITAPADQSILTTIQPTITCVFSDVESGCVPDSFRILLNGADHTDLFTIDQTSASAAITDPVSFPEGTFTIWASIADRGGNRDTASIQCTIDISTPLLSIDTPEDGVPINNPQPTVTITYSDAVSGININTLSITLNGIDKTPFFTIDATHATWEVGPEHALGEGVYQLEATIADHGGNAAAANSGFEIDLTPPEVAITGPADGYITNISELTIIWTIDGVEQSEQTSVTLVEGANTIIRTATDAAGNTGADMIHVTLDTQPPVVAISSPLDGFLTNQPTIAVEWSVDGVAQTEQLTENLVEGANTITRSATDAAGNTGTATVSGTLDTQAPVVEITSPVDGFITNESALTITWTIDGVEQAEQTSVTLVEGANTIIRTATDAAGNTGADTINVTLDTSPPLVIITSPQDGEVINESPVSVSWKVDNSEQTQDVIEELAQGTNIIIRSYTDAAGNEGADTVYVVFHPGENYEAWWDYSRKVFIRTETDAMISEMVTRFPLLLRLNECNFPFHEAKTDGSDFRAASPNGEHLHYQIEQWDAGNKQALVWVLADTIYPNSDIQYVRIYWGNSSAVDSSNGSMVFDSANGFSSVWHLSDLNDATPNHNNGTNAGTVSGEGVIGEARRFDGNDDIIHVPHNASFDFTSSMSISAWVRADKTQNSDWPRIIDKYLHPSSGFSLILTRVERRPRADFRGMQSEYINVDGIESVNDNEWHFLSAVLKNGTFSLYIDGQLSGSRTTPSMIKSNSKELTIGNGFDRNVYFPFKGYIDEVRLNRTGKSASWVKLSFQNQMLSSDLLYYGPIEGKPMIVIQSPGQALSEYDSVTLKVAARGTPPVSYQWYRDGTEMSGDTLDSIALNGSDGLGVYTCRISNSKGVFEGNPISVTRRTIYSEWRNERRIEIRTKLSEYGLCSDEYEFPTLISLDRSRFNFARSRGHGEDLRFSKPDGTPVYFEIEQWDSVQGIASIWVLLDTILAVDTVKTIVMYWGNNSASTMSHPEMVFDTANGFTGVWHFSAGCIDATANRINGVSKGTAQVQGRLGMAQRFDSDTDIVEMPPPILRLISLTVCQYLLGFEPKKTNHIFGHV